MKILFIITGSIAVKKCYEILKKLELNNIIVDCIVTDKAKKMVNINNLKKIISGKIYTNDSEKKNKMLHIKLSRESDLIAVCPATANTIAKFSSGIANDLASNALIASNKQIIIIPAMNVEMWNNPTNKLNVAKLINNGVEFIGPEHGRLSCGEIGLGRLSQPNKIFKILKEKINKSIVFKNKNILITAGPTIEPIDTVRFISNFSSGKQGYEIAKQMLLSGAKVTLISGPTNLPPPFKSKFIQVISSEEMFKEVKKNSNVDIAIFTAAVSDFSPKKISKSKIKKENFKKMYLKKTQDILYEISSLKKNRPKFIVGFAAETDNHLINAKKKLIRKKCDLIVVNKIDEKNKVFGSDFNKVSIITNKKIINFKKTSKINVAKKLLKLINDLY